MKFLTSLSVLAFTLLLPSTSHALLAPWYYQLALIRSTLGADPCVKVGDLITLPPAAPSAPSQMIIPIEVCDTKTAKTLQAATPTSFLEGALQLQFSDKHGRLADQPVSWSREEMQSRLNAALKGNPYFDAVSDSMMGSVAVFKPQVVQFFCDDILVPGGNCSFLAADAFRMILKNRISENNLNFATAPKR